MIRRRKYTTACGAAVLLLLASGCDSESDAPTDRTTQPDVLYSNVWSADSDVDLFSRGAELIRATYEAGIYATYVGADDSYPGYRGAVGEPTGPGNEDKREYFTWRKPENTTQVARTDFSALVNSTQRTMSSAEASAWVLLPPASVRVEPLSYGSISARSWVDSS